MAPEEVRHVFVTHIHLDHAGAAWRLAELGATVYVHPKGAPHLVDPSRLLASAERIYGAMLRPLWGELRGIPPERSGSWPMGRGWRWVGSGCRPWRPWATPATTTPTWWRASSSPGTSPGCASPRDPSFPPRRPRTSTWRAGTLLGPSPGLAPRGPLPHPLRGLWGRGGPPPGPEGNPGGLGGLGAPPPKGGALPGGDDRRFEAYWREGLGRAGVEEAGMRLYELADPPYMNLQGLVRYWQKHHRGLGGVDGLAFSPGPEGPDGRLRLREGDEPRGPPPGLPPGAPLGGGGPGGLGQPLRLGPGAGKKARDRGPGPPLAGAEGL